MARRPCLLRSLAPVVLLACAACSPTFDWRDARFPEADDVAALFPCKPERATRQLRLAGETVAFGLASCSAGSLTFALAHAELADAARVAPAVRELQDLATANVGGLATLPPPVRVAGAASEPAVRRVAWQGRRPDGSPLREDAVFFARGRHVFQASVVGGAIDDEVADTFFAGLKLARRP